MESTVTREKTSQSTRTAFDIVEVIAERDRPSISEIAEAVDYSRSTVHYHLKTLERNRYVVRDEEDSGSVSGWPTRRPRAARTPLEGIVGRPVEETDSVDDPVETVYGLLDWRWPAVQWDREKYYAGEVFSASPLETVPVAVAILAVCDGDVNRAIIEGGRNRNFFEELEGDPDADFRSMAGRLVAALENERDGAADRSGTLARLLGGDA